MTATADRADGWVQRYTGPFELPEPEGELRAMVERMVERKVRNVSTR